MRRRRKRSPDLGATAYWLASVAVLHLVESADGRDFLDSHGWDPETRGLLDAELRCISDELANRYEIVPCFWCKGTGEEPEA